MAADDKAIERPGSGLQAVVAPRRTVQIDGKLHGPGMLVRLSKPDVTRLRALGYLVDPKAETPPADGPSIATDHTES